MKETHRELIKNLKQFAKGSKDIVVQDFYLSTQQYYKKAD